MATQDPPNDARRFIPRTLHHGDHSPLGAASRAAELTHFVDELREVVRLLGSARI